jgi:hypothetical protein
MFRQKFGFFIKLLILANIGLRSMMSTSNESINNMQLSHKVGYKIHFGKIGEIKFSKNQSEIF